VRLNPDVGDAKSQAGRRLIGLPDELVRILQDHRAAQDDQRKRARQLWQESGWVFTTAVGRPLSSNSD
jgi:integrase